MQKLKIIILLFFLVFLPGMLSGQVASVSKNIVKELTEYVAKKGTKELAEYGGEMGIKKSLQAIAEAGGETCAKRAVMYSKIYGVDALKAIEISPQRIIQLLDDIPTDSKAHIIAFIRKTPKDEMLGRINKEGIRFLKLEAKHPAWGRRISELGPEVTEFALALPKKEIRLLARNSEPLKAVKKIDPAQYSKAIDTLKSAPAKTLDILEKSPNLLFTGGALAAFISSKNELFGSSESPGFIERQFSPAFTVINGMIIVLVIVFAMVLISFLYRKTKKIKSCLRVLRKNLPKSF